MRERERERLLFDKAFLDQISSTCSFPARSLPQRQASAPDATREGLDAEVFCLYKRGKEERRAGRRRKRRTKNRGRATASRLSSLAGERSEERANKEREKIDFFSSKFVTFYKLYQPPPHHHHLVVLRSPRRGLELGPHPRGVLFHDRDGGGGDGQDGESEFDLASISFLLHLATRWSSASSAASSLPEASSSHCRRRRRRRRAGRSHCSPRGRTAACGPPWSPARRGRRPAGSRRPWARRSKRKSTKESSKKKVRFRFRLLLFRLLPPSLPPPPPR